MNEKVAIRRHSPSVQFQSIKDWPRGKRKNSFQAKIWMSDLLAFFGCLFLFLSFSSPSLGTTTNTLTNKLTQN